MQDKNKPHNFIQREYSIGDHYGGFFVDIKGFWYLTTTKKVKLKWFVK